MQKYYQNEARFEGVYSWNNLLKTNDGPYAFNPDEFKSIRTHWIVLHVNGDNVTYFDSFKFECILKETMKFIGLKNITANIYKI